MKTIGLMCAWGVEDLIVPVLSNHLKICDEIYVCIAPHHKQFEFLKDETETRAVEYFKTDSRVKFIHHSGYASSNDHVKCIILNKMLNASKFKENDVVMICDSDEFYDSSAIAELKEHFRQNDWDRLEISDRFFVFNRNWYVTSTHYRFFRLKTAAAFDVPQRMLPSPKTNKVVLKNCPMFHFSMLANPEYRRIHWSVEGCANPKKVRWFNEIYLRWDPTNLALCKNLAEKNLQISGRHGFWVNSNVGEPKDLPYVYKYDGDFPVECQGFQ